MHLYRRTFVGVDELYTVICYSETSSSVITHDDGSHGDRVFTVVRLFVCLSVFPHDISYLKN